VPEAFPATVRALMALTENTLGELEHYYNLPGLPDPTISARRERFRNFIGVGMITN
jgi:hypothetical protein